MIEENQYLSIFGPAFSITAYSAGILFDYDSDALLENVDGWNSATKNIKTVQKGIGSGSYIVSTEIPEREVTVKINFQKSDPADLRTILRNVKFSMLHDDDFDLQLNQEATDYTAYQSESLRGRLKGYKWNQTGLNAYLEITFLCTDPENNINAQDPTNGYIYDRGY